MIFVITRQIGKVFLVGCETEAFALFNMAKARDPEGTIVEIGSAYGRSTVCLAWGASVGGADQVHAVDPHTGDISVLESWGEKKAQFNSFDGFLKNINRLGLMEHVVPVKLASKEAAEGWDGTPIRLLFIDGWHTYEAVKHDILTWSKYVVSNGKIVIHDFHHEGVRRAIFDSMEILGLPPWRLEPVSKSMMLFLLP